MVHDLLLGVGDLCGVVVRRADGDERSFATMMTDLIEALTIFAKYKNEKRPTHCEHDVLWIIGVTKDEVSEEDQCRLDALGFFFAEGDECWQSFRFGSA